MKGNERILFIWIPMIIMGLSMIMAGYFEQFLIIGVAVCIYGVLLIPFAKLLKVI